MLPVLIGSKALQHYGYTEEAQDIDIIVDTATRNSLSGECYKKEGDMIWMTKESKKVDIIIATEGTANLYIFEMCNKEANNIKITVENMQVIVPPLEVLYAIKKSHIHRVIPVTKNQDQDMEVWRKQLRMYNWMRNKLDYKKLDEMIYGLDRYSEPLSDKKLDSDTDLSYLVRSVFLKKFNETNSRVGDTKNNLDQEEKEFFDDNVKRYIEHDKLHELVAQECRGTLDLLFTEYQKPEDKVNLDKELFFKFDLNHHMQNYREEIMVLLLERKWIPELVTCYKEDNTPYKTYDKVKKQEELLESVCHFVTNLCGSGHHWLRRYALDHYHIISNLEGYDLDTLNSVAIKVSGVSEIDILKNKSMETLKEVINKYKNSNQRFVDCLKKVIKNSAYVNPLKGKFLFCKSSNEIHRELQTTLFNNEYISKINIVFYKNSLSNLFDMFEADTTISYTSSSSIQKFYNDSTKYCTVTNFFMYDYKNNIGLYFKDNNILSEVFSLEFVKKESKYYYGYHEGDFCVNSYTVNIEELQFVTLENTFSKKTKQHYYYSDGSCNGSARQIPNGKQDVYLSKYGSSPKYLTNFLEYISRNVLDLLKDKYEKSDDDTDSDSDSDSDVGDTNNHTYYVYSDRDEEYKNEQPPVEEEGPSDCGTQ